MISLFTLTLFLIFLCVCFSFQRSSRRSSRFALLLAFFSIKFQLLNSKFKSLQIIIKNHTDFLCCFVLSLLLVCVFLLHPIVCFSSSLSLRLESIGRENCRGEKCHLEESFPRASLWLGAPQLLRRKLTTTTGGEECNFLFLINSLFAVFFLFGREF